MRAFLVTTLVCFAIYLLLTTGSGTAVFGLWSYEELILGLILSMIAGFVARTIFVKKSYRMLNPLRWIIFLGYLIGPFFVALTKANLDVAYRVITGKIRPGIVKISPELKTDFGITLLANSITLTPGTLTVDVDNETNALYVHWINVKNEVLEKKPVQCSDICGNFQNWVRRIAE